MHHLVLDSEAGDAPARYTLENATLVEPPFEEEDDT